MVPEGKDGADGLTSPKNIAQIMATYKHMNGGSSAKNSALSETLLAGNDTALLK